MKLMLVIHPKGNRIVSYVIERTTACHNSLSYVLAEAAYEGRYELFPEAQSSGWTKEQLIAYYALTEAQYETVMGCLKRIRQGVRA